MRNEEFVIARLYYKSKQSSACEIPAGKGKCI